MNKKISEFSIKELKDAFLGLWPLINDEAIQCYNTKDMMLLDAYEAELYQRGYHVETRTDIRIVKSRD